jgi:hypothetical protein
LREENSIPIFKQQEFVTVKATLLQDQLKANLQYELLLKQRDEEIRRLKIGMEFLREENKELKNARYVDLRG